jgi:hypothetical protein
MEIGKCEHCLKEKPLYGYDHFFAHLCFDCWLQRNANSHHGTPDFKKIHFDQLQRMVGKWGNDTFPNSTLHSRCAHAAKELAELEASGEGVEAADVFMLLLHDAHNRGYSLYDETIKKFAEVQTREWGEPDADGVIEHIRQS